MPLLGLLLLNGALGLAAALASSRELRSSPRAVVWSRGFAALGLHEALVAAPAVAYLLARFGDWMVSYTVDGGRLPSAVVVVAVMVHAGVSLAGYALGARWLREHHGRRASVAAGALGALAVLGALVAHTRLGLVGSYVQHRGGFGLTPFRASRALGVTGVLGAVYAAAAGHLFWSLRARL